MPASAFDAMDFWSKVGVGIITGAIAALVTAKVTLRRFYHEKWWERKHQAYNELVNNLFELQLFYKQAVRVSVRARKRNGHAEEEKLDWDKSADLYSAIQRQLALSPISLSNKTETLVNDFFKNSHAKSLEYFEEGMPEEIVYEEKVSMLKEVIREITHDAKKELKFR